MHARMIAYPDGAGKLDPSKRGTEMGLSGTAIKPLRVFKGTLQVKRLLMEKPVLAVPRLLALQL